MTKTLLHRHTLATSLFLLSTFSPCAGIRQKSQQDIDGEELLNAIRYMENNDGYKKEAIALLNKTPTPNLDIQDDRGITTLHWASVDGHTEIVELLLQKGANPSPQDKHNRTPLHDAAEKGDTNIVQLLLQYNADKNACSKTNRTPLHEAAKKGHQDVVALLLKNSANKDVLNNSHNTPLHVAVEYLHKDIVELLLQYKADTNIQNNNKETPLTLAKAKQKKINKYVSNNKNSRDIQAIITLLEAHNQDNPNGTPSPKPVQIPTNTNTNLNQGGTSNLNPLPFNTSNNLSATQLNTANSLLQGEKSTLFNPKNILIDTTILILLGILGYLFLPTQDDDTPRHTKSNAQQEQSTKTTRTATAK